MLVALPIEIKSREFQSRLYLASKLLERNINCVIGNKPSVNDYGFNYGDRYIYIGKSMSLNTYKAIKQSGGKFTVLDEEGGVYYKDYESSLNLRATDEVLEHVDLYFSWGTIQRDFLLDNRKNIDKGRIVVSGNPRFDLVKSNFSSYHVQSSKIAKEFSDGYLLIPTRFKRSNHQLGDEGSVKVIDHLPESKAKLMKENVLHSDARNKRDTDYQKELFGHFIEAIKSLSTTFADLPIIIRPHPTENVDTYKELFAAYHNVHIRKDGSIFEWFANAKLVIHHDCTTGLEAMLHGLPTVSYVPILDEDLIQWLPVKSGFQIDTLETLIDTVRGHVVERVDKEYFYQQYDVELIKTFIANVDFDAADKIADTLVDKLDQWSVGKWECDTNFSHNKSSIVNKVFRKLKVLASWGSADYKEKQQVKLMKKDKFPDFSVDEVETKLEAFMKIACDGTFDVSVKMISKDCVLLERT
jgi:surface carbohydrate biosynthesis protein